MIRGIIKKFENNWSNDEVKNSAQDLGMQTLNGQSVHVYSFTSHGTPATLYISPEDLPVENVVKSKKMTTTITPSEYNQRISVEP